jgi:hypothetical protein
MGKKGSGGRGGRDGKGRFEKGAPAGPGRPKGSTNASSRMVQEKCELMGIDPVAVLILFTGNRWQELGYKSEKNKFGFPTIPTKLRAECAMELANYIAPKLKSIEHTGEGGGPMITEVVYETAWRDAPGAEGDENPAAVPPDGGAAPGAPKPPSE